ncbi:PREDICTED: omega-conotoxin-like protein 1 [Wasmannia auropunctata]|uniref:omega-conotoxin-like protein 1 n=1 Tax=Wasmannia auropunctata TaxID=64793 RepID=UPI0005EE7EBE|nr:PREDICTED: omega-conotoxin-like protein 1 [Wasmannia auropunctata]
MDKIKFVVFTIFVMIAMAIMVTSKRCNPHGGPCRTDEDCCGPFRCHPWGYNCTES